MQKTQFSKGIFWRSFVEQKTEETCCLAKRRSHRSVAFAASVEKTVLSKLLKVTI